MSGEVASPPGISHHILKPYASLVVLLCPQDIDADVAFSQLAAHLRQIRRINQSRLAADIVADGIDGKSSSDHSDPTAAFDQVELTIHRVESRPGWLKEPSYIDVQHEITVAFRKGRLIAVHLPGSIRDAFQTWLDKPPRPMVRRVASSHFEQALLQGESRGLWLRGTHSRKKTKADSKNIAGSDLRQTLSAVEDQTYAMNSARSVLAATPARVALTGTVGTTPTRSLVWNKPTGSLDEFAQCALELLELIEETMSVGPDGAPAFPLLAQPVFDLTNVWGAYDLAVSNAAELPDDTDVTKLVAATLLESAVLNIEGEDNSPDFRLEIGQNMCVGGVMRGRIWRTDDSAQLRLGLLGSPTDPVIAIPVRDALQHTDLLTIYYASGHTFTQGTLYWPQVKPRPFPNWEWKDFAGYNISKEKPGASKWGPAEIHEAIGHDGDTSIFGWVRENFASGWLTCDDGPGEIADFIHVDAEDLTISLIHVKGAENDSPNRGVSASAYEVVTGQAVKNAIFLDDDVLTEHLKSPPTTSPATWSDGVRETDRNYLLEAIAARDARSAFRVVIVQPHVSKLIYDRFHSSALSDARPSANLLRLHRLENILNGGRPTMTGMGSDLFVFGSLV